MPVYKVKVKWGKEVYKNIEINTDVEPMLFKAQLFALTNVLPERQRIVSKGQTLKENEWNIPIDNKSILLMIGTNSEVPSEPMEPVKFIEDMSEAELATAMQLPAGLVNLGNTCYMNATLQCLKSVPELRNSLLEYKDMFTVEALDYAVPITAATRALFEQMDQPNAVTPIILLQTLHSAFPQFAQTGEKGAYKQQDANECWSELLKMFQRKLPAIKSEESSTEYKSMIEQYFGGTFDVEMKCNEATEEPTKQSKEDFLQLSCFISQEVKYMQSGLKSKLKEQLTKMSPVLQRDAIYTKTSLISRLPAYLTVNFVRFQYKAKEGINAKVLKDIKFPLDFDAFELCTPALQRKLTPMRSKFKIVDDAHLEKQSNLDEKLKTIPTEKKDGEEGNSPVRETYCFSDDLGSNNSGYYALQAVLTHQGRSSSSGHYVGWVRLENEKWAKFDDDVVTAVSADDVLRLSGGGDWHCAYVLLYGPKILEYPSEFIEKMKEV